jgi:hypothetical protein
MTHTMNIRGKRPLWLILGAVALASACAGVLGLKPRGPHAFEHRAHVLKGISCLSCHQGVDQAGDTAPMHLPDTAKCMECHARPHDSRTCTNCHGEPMMRERAAQARHYLRFEHSQHVPRLSGDCVRCHVDIQRDGAALRPSMATCLGCHAHRDQFAVRDCQGCHVDLRAELTRPSSHLVHEGDFVREHGARAAAASDLCSTCHTQSFCASCHGQTMPMIAERMAFDATLAAGVHRAGFASRHAEEARAQPGLCTTCHSEDSCAGCHAEKGITAVQAGGSPHPAGWLGLPGQRNEHGRAAWRNPAECASCHGGAGEALCIGCHRVGGVGGNPHPAGWSSTRNRASDMPCRLCHTGGL